MLKLFRRWRFLIAPILTIMLLAVNLSALTAHAHSIDGWHWHRGGNAVYIYEWNTATFYSDAENARRDKWNHIGILYNYAVGYHTDVSVFDGNWGPTGWSGLAEWWDSWDWGCWCWDHISHGHARYNSYYNYPSYWRQYVFCQEVFHTYGFDHDNYGGCMDYNGTVNVLVNHNINDFYGRYQFH
jgi:hypothetical protein